MFLQNTNIASKYILYLLFSILITYFIFSPVINIPFYHHDTYKFSFGGHNVSCNLEVGYSFLFDLARPFTAFFDCLNFKIANTLEKMSYMRMACLIFIGFTMSLFALWLNRIIQSFWGAFFISGAIFYLPAMQTTMIMSAMFLIFSIFVAFLAYLFIDKGFLIFFSKKTQFKYKKVFGASLIAIGLGFLFISFFTYPSLTAFYLLPSMVLILFSPLSTWTSPNHQINASVAIDLRTRVLRDILIFSLSSIIFYFIAKHIQAARVGSSIDQFISTYKYHLNFDLLKRLKNLVEYWPSLWNLYFGYWQSLIIYTTLFAGILIGAARYIYHYDAREKSLTHLIQILFVILVLVLCSASFYLVQPENVLFSRIIFAFEAMLVVILAWSLQQISYIFRSMMQQAFTALLCGLFLAGGMMTNYITNLSALNANIEFNFITAKIAELALIQKKKILRIHLIPLQNNISFVGLDPREDIFNNTSVVSGDGGTVVNAALLRFTERNNFTIHNCILPNNIEQSKYYIEERKCIESAPAGSIVVTFNYPGNSIQPSPNMLIIDMNILGSLAKPA